MRLAQHIAALRASVRCEATGDEAARHRRYSEPEARAIQRRGLEGAPFDGTNGRLGKLQCFIIL